MAACLTHASGAYRRHASSNGASPSYAYPTLSLSNNSPLGSNIRTRIKPNQNQWQTRTKNGRRLASPPLRAVWKKNSAEVSVSAPVDFCFDLWEDRPRIPEWMRWIKSVEVQEDDPRLSVWSLETEQFGQKFRFSWLARNMTPIKNRLIHWVSVEDKDGRGGNGMLLQGFASIQNKGEIQFRKTNEKECVIRLVISYQLPDILLPLVDLLKPTVDGILLEYMRNFETVAVAEHQHALEEKN